MSAFILRRLPRPARRPVQTAARGAAVISLAVCPAVGLPLLSQIGAATLAYLAALAVPALTWRGTRRVARWYRKRQR